MSDWMKKRFWTDVTVTEMEHGFGLALDGRSIKTPLKVPLVVPTRAFADRIAEEWRAVGETIDPTKMPFTRAANASIDKLTKQKDEVVAMLGEYGGSDLVCYRATHPEGLIAQQAEAWDPLVDWAAKQFGARLNVTAGVLPIAQPSAPVAAMQNRLAEMTEYELAGAHDLVAISGSLVIALAVIDGPLTPETAWHSSRIDESWQISEWGADDEAEALADVKRADFERAALIFKLSQV